MQYTFTPETIENVKAEGVYSYTYEDGSGNLLTVCESGDMMIKPESSEIQSFLDDCGYDGDNEWSERL